jgi:hypothetical protein
MNEEYDSPSSPDLRAKLFREGKIVFLLSKREARMLRGVAEIDLKLGMINRRPGLKHRIYMWYLAFIGAIKTLAVSVQSGRTADAFAFLAINKSDIRNIDEKEMSDGNVTLTFYKKNWGK